MARTQDTGMRLQASISVGAATLATISVDLAAGAAETESKSIGNLVTLGLSAKMLRTSLQKHMGTVMQAHILQMQSLSHSARF